METLQQDRIKDFLGISVKYEIPEFGIRLEQKRFKFVVACKQYRTYKGSYLGEDDCYVSLFAKNPNSPLMKIGHIEVLTTECKEWTSLFDKFCDLQKKLTSDFGDFTTTVNTIDQSINISDDDKLVGVKSGIFTIESRWDKGIKLSINKDQRISIVFGGEEIGGLPNAFDENDTIRIPEYCLFAKIVLWLSILRGVRTAILGLTYIGSDPNALLKILCSLIIAISSALILKHKWGIFSFVVFLISSLIATFYFVVDLPWYGNILFIVLLMSSLSCKKNGISGWDVLFDKVDNTKDGLDADVKIHQDKSSDNQLEFARSVEHGQVSNEKNEEVAMESKELDTKNVESEVPDDKAEMTQISEPVTQKTIVSKVDDGSINPQPSIDSGEIEELMIDVVSLDEAEKVHVTASLNNRKPHPAWAVVVRIALWTLFILFSCALGGLGFLAYSIFSAFEKKVYKSIKYGKTFAEID